MKKRKTGAVSYTRGLPIFTQILSSIHKIYWEIGVQNMQTSFDYNASKTISDTVVTFIYQSLIISGDWSKRLSVRLSSPHHHHNFLNVLILDIIHVVEDLKNVVQDS